MNGEWATVEERIEDVKVACTGATTASPATFTSVAGYTNGSFSRRPRSLGLNLFPELVTVAEKNLSRMEAAVSEIRSGYAEGHARTAKALADIREVLAPMVQP